MGRGWQGGNGVCLRLSGQGTQLETVESVHESTSLSLNGFYLRANLF